MIKFIIIYEKNISKNVPLCVFSNSFNCQIGASLPFLLDPSLEFHASIDVCQLELAQRLQEGKEYESLLANRPYEKTRSLKSKYKDGHHDTRQKLHKSNSSIDKYVRILRTLLELYHTHTHSFYGAYKKV